MNIDDIVDDLARKHHLTKKQELVLQHLVFGKSQKEIAAELELATETVRNHVIEILRKFEVENTLKLLAKIMQRLAERTDGHEKTKRA